MSTNARLVLIAEQAGASSTMEDSSIETGVGASIAVLSIILVGLRFYVRYYMHVGFKWDDWLILVSLIFVIATDILVVYGGYQTLSLSLLVSLDNNSASSQQYSSQRGLCSFDTRYTI